MPLGIEDGAGRAPETAANNPDENDQTKKSLCEAGMEHTDLVL